MITIILIVLLAVFFTAVLMHNVYQIRQWFNSPTQADVDKNSVAWHNWQLVHVGIGVTAIILFYLYASGAPDKTVTFIKIFTSYNSLHWLLMDGFLNRSRGLQWIRRGTAKGNIFERYGTEGAKYVYIGIAILLWVLL